MNVVLICSTCEQPEMVDDVDRLEATIKTLQGQGYENCEYTCSICNGGKWRLLPSEVLSA